MKLTRQQAISAKCKDCIYDEKEAGSWVKQVEMCTSTDCALYEYRPKTEAKKAQEREAMVQAMSEEDRLKYQEKQRINSERMRKINAKH